MLVKSVGCRLIGVFLNPPQVPFASNGSFVTCFLEYLSKGFRCTGRRLLFSGSRGLSKHSINPLRFGYSPVSIIARVGVHPGMENAFSNRAWPTMLKAMDLLCANSCCPP
jgi:hypothetical protein